MDETDADISARLLKEGEMISIIERNRVWNSERGFSRKYSDTVNPIVSDIEVKATNEESTSDGNSSGRGFGQRRTEEDTVGDVEFKHLFSSTAGEEIRRIDVLV